MGQGSVAAEMTEEQREERNRKQHEYQAKGKAEIEKVQGANAASSILATPTLADSFASINHKRQENVDRADPDPALYRLQIGLSNSLL
ncbi:hypothetical protein BDA96_02G181300 [Sorghum bicolor]|uniref:Uncharacterized protein n=1 Tax=Sorghum bicolor TaxID=4558 RepID=A0A921RP67_SORBI|nr:hypothetical protein BDA96_02G181300 [Sorghum bicolor]